jgi:predicted choloylglycine hydrolase
MSGLHPSRRQFLRGAASLPALGLLPRQQSAVRATEHTLTVITGTPLERGRTYGTRLREGIHSFLEREILLGFGGKPNPRERMLRYAGACAREIRAYAPEIHEELEGMAEGAELSLEEVVLVTCHEELWHGGLVPASDHCTVFGASKPDTEDGETFVCQTWDWMESVYGLSTMLLWKRAEGPSVLAYAYPGLWTGAGMNSEGLALCWHTGYGGGDEPRVGIPAYVVIARMLYEDTLAGALKQAKRAKQAGWFQFLVGDARGEFRTLHGTPKKLDVDDGARCNGGLVRAEGRTKVDLARLQEECGRVKVDITIDSMIFDCSRREAHVTRRAGGVTPWARFGFEG